MRRRLATSMIVRRDRGALAGVLYAGCPARAGTAMASHFDQRAPALLAEAVTFPERGINAGPEMPDESQLPWRSVAPGEPDSGQIIDN